MANKEETQSIGFLSPIEQRDNIKFYVGKEVVMQISKEGFFTKESE